MNYINQLIDLSSETKNCEVSNSIEEIEIEWLPFVDFYLFLDIALRILILSFFLWCLFISLICLISIIFIFLLVYFLKISDNLQSLFLHVIVWENQSTHFLIIVRMVFCELITSLSVALFAIKLLGFGKLNLTRSVSTREMIVPITALDSCTRDSCS